MKPYAVKAKMVSKGQPATLASRQLQDSIRKMIMHCNDTNVLMEIMNKLRESVEFKWEQR